MARVQFIMINTIPLSLPCLMLVDDIIQRVMLGILARTLTEFYLNYVNFGIYCTIHCEKNSENMP